MRIALFPRTMLDIVEERLLAAMQEVVHERRQAGRPSLRALCEIVVSVEQRSGAARFGPKAQVMHQQVQARSAGLGVLVKVIRGVEQRMRAAALPSAVKQVVR